MTREDIIRMAALAGFEIDCCSLEWHDRIERFAALVAEEVRGRTIESEKAGWLYALDKVVEAERETCIAIAESKRHSPNFVLASIPSQNGTAVDIANLICARGEK